jgi:hypothetical protein
MLYRPRTGCRGSLWNKFSHHIYRLYSRCTGFRGSLWTNFSSYI